MGKKEGWKKDESRREGKQGGLDKRGRRTERAREEKKQGRYERRGGRKEGVGESRERREEGKGMEAIKAEVK